MKKCHILLGMYDDLLSGEIIRIDVCCAEFGISVSTFRRYIACLRDFLDEKHSREIVYLSEVKGYILDGKTGSLRLKGKGDN